MNTVCTEQNTERQLDRLAAQRELYSVSKSAFAVHGILSTLMASVLAVSAMFCADVKPWAVVWGVALLILDQLWLTPWQKDLRRQAALVQESFDCDVLGLPWGATLKIGKPVEHGMVVARANAYRRKEPSFESLRDWYPGAVCRMPLFLARIVCQRTNAWWDGKQRRHYATFLIAGVVVAILLLLCIGLAQNMQLADLLLTILGPLASGISLALKQYKENSEAADRLDKLKEHADELFRRALEGATEAELAPSSRLLQDELFDHRKRNVPVFDWLYRLLRYGQELQMQENAEEMVRQLEARRGSGR